MIPQDPSDALLLGVTVGAALAIAFVALIVTIARLGPDLDGDE
jgi:hypothetical protein